MGLLARLLGRQGDDNAHVRPLWHAVVARARDPRLYAHCGVADTVPGRFDAITLVLSLVLLRMEKDAELAPHTGRLTELFVSDMDSQLRESGVGDLVVGKHIGKQMMVLGGRLGALRDALAQADDAALLAAIGRNVTLLDGADPALLAAELRALAARLTAKDAAAIMAGDLT